MSLPWYYQDRLLNDRYGELLREAQHERRAREARGDEANSPTLPRLFNWLEEQAGAVRQRAARWTGRRKSLASQTRSYLDNPDPFKDCETC
jgi:hypothetical protein